jgi:phosphomannomutase
MEVACGYLSDVLAAQAAAEGPVVLSRDLEEASRQLARAAYRVDLSEGALVRWLGVACTSAFGAATPSRALTRQLSAWAADEFAAAGAADRPWVA